MKLPVSWLAEYIDISDLSVRDLADRITFAGIEIEAITESGANFNNIVAGEVRECEMHPDSDHLHVTSVFDGEKEVRVVCGAPNCRAGLVVPFAKIGATLPDGTTIKKGKLRGVESFGMLCSARELGLSGDHAGIMELDAASVAPGTPCAVLFGEAETVFDVEITWNRADCLSIIGIAREFAAILGRPLKMPAVDFPSLPQGAAEMCSVSVLNGAGCPDYTARVLPHVERLPSPEWMRKRLELCGVRSIDIVVDVSNYVMLECGQPLHTFDYEMVGGRAIVVRDAREGESIKTLDGVERKLDASMLVIADERAPLAVAGVMGGEGSEIRPETCSVLLESASFAAPSIKRTATALGMRTEASHRYERGVDPFLTDWASRRACHLLAKHANATVASGAVDADARDPQPREVALRFERARKVIGLDISDAKQSAILESLGFKRVDSDAETEERAAQLYRVPSYRIDVDCEADLIEEIARMSGLDALPDIPPTAMVVPGADDVPIRAAAALRRGLVSLGLTEVMNYSFTSAAVLDAFSKTDAQRRVILPNPVSADCAILRDSLLPQLADTIAYNNAHGVTTGAIFEAGRVFYHAAAAKNAAAAKDAAAATASATAEEDRVAAGMFGYAGRQTLDSIRTVPPSETILWLKGALETLATLLKTPPLRFEPADIDGFEPGYSAKIIIAGREEGVFGMLAKTTAKKWRLNTPVALAELRRDALTRNAFKAATAVDIPSNPGTTRDIALIAGAGVTNEQITTVIKKSAPPELRAVKLFDIFSGKALGAGKTSYAYSLEYRADGRTLKDEEANAFHEKIKTALKTQLSVEIREG